MFYAFRFATVIASAFILAASPARADNWAVDVGHSYVRFDVRHFFSRVQGDFRGFKEKTFQFDTKDITKGQVEIEVDSKSIDTNNEKRDNHLRSPDFFDADRCPTLNFKSTKVSKGGDGKYTLEGDLTMRCVTKPVKFAMEFLGAGELGGMMGTRAGFTAKATINRKDFGINWNKTLDNGGVMLSDEVEILLGIEAKKK